MFCLCQDRIPVPRQSCASSSHWVAFKEMMSRGRYHRADAAALAWRANSPDGNCARSGLVAGWAALWTESLWTESLWSESLGLGFFAVSISWPCFVFIARTCLGLVSHNARLFGTSPAPAAAINWRREGDCTFFIPVSCSDHRTAGQWQGVKRLRALRVPGFVQGGGAVARRQPN